MKPFSNSIWQLTGVIQRNVSLSRDTNPRHLNFTVVVPCVLASAPPTLHPAPCTAHPSTKSKKAAHPTAEDTETIFYSTAIIETMKTTSNLTTITKLTMNTRRERRKERHEEVKTKETGQKHVHWSVETRSSSLWPDIGCDVYSTPPLGAAPPPYLAQNETQGGS